METIPQHLPGKWTNTERHALRGKMDSSCQTRQWMLFPCLAYWLVPCICRARKLRNIQSFFLLEHDPWMAALQVHNSPSRPGLPWWWWWGGGEGHMGHPWIENDTARMPVKLGACSSLRSVFLCCATAIPYYCWTISTFGFVFLHLFSKGGWLKTLNREVYSLEKSNRPLNSCPLPRPVGAHSLSRIETTCKYF